MHNDLNQDLDRVLLTADQIAARVAEMASEVLAGFQDDQGDTPEITPVPIMTGAFIFAADLIRQLPQKMQIHLMHASSYAGTATTTTAADPSQVKLDATLSNVPADLTGRHVLVLDDILDSGHTLAAVTAELKKRNPAGLKTCVLLRKQRDAALNFPIDHVAFDIPDEFVVGYGLDYDGYYRNLPHIGVLSQAAIDAHLPESP
ncbi:MAG: hypoxanthine phosphoribosyltransferase [Planctomycetota bacterium]